MITIDGSSGPNGSHVAHNGNISYTTEEFYGPDYRLQSIYTHIATIKGKGTKHSHVSTKNLLIVGISKNIDQINKFFDAYNHLIKSVDIKTSHGILHLFIYKRKRLGQTDTWAGRELKLLLRK